MNKKSTEDILAEAKSRLSAVGVQIDSFVLRGVDAPLAVILLNEFLKKRGSLFSYQRLGISKEAAESMLAMIMSGASEETSTRILQIQKIIESGEDGKREEAQAELSNILHTEAMRNPEVMSRLLESMSKTELTPIADILALHEIGVKALTMVCGCLKIPTEKLNNRPPEDQS